jgi:hypothetical protein
MDPISQKRLEEIIATGPDSITEADAAFLRARRSYLNSEQTKVFAEALAEVQNPPDGPADDLAEEKPAKKPAK